MAIDTLKWNGSAWVATPVRKWNGSAWVDAYTRKWTGSYWSQMYPETAVSITKYITSTGTNNYRNNTWEGGPAKQGNWGYGNSQGYLGICSTAFPGFGNIVNVTGAGFRGNRDGSGYYNNDQTIRFFRSNAVPGYNPTNTLAGEFNATTGAPGSGGRMVDRWINGNGIGNMKDWANGIGGKDQAFIYDTTKTGYMGVNNPELGMDYTYMAKTISFESPYMMLMMTPDMYMDVKGRNPYHSMVIYEDEIGLSLPELMERRESGIITPIDTADVIDVPETMPWTREYTILETIDILAGEASRVFRIEVFNLRFDDRPEISLDGTIWFPIRGIKENHDDYLLYELPKDFNKNTDSIYFRIHDTLNDVIISEKTIIPCDMDNELNLL